MPVSVSVSVKNTSRAVFTACVKTRAGVTAPGSRPLVTVNSATSSASDLPHSLSRRDFVRAGGVGLGLALGGLIAPPNAHAIELSEGQDAAWQTIGGGPADLTYPQSWLGEWDVISTLVSVETPLGADATPDPAEVQRARATELNQPANYSLRFTLNGRGQVVADRPFNTASMLRPYPGMPEMKYSWNVDDPNVLTLILPGGPGRTATSRVTRRYEDRDDNTRALATSELFELVFEAPGDGAPERRTRVKKNRCLTKYKWRTEEEAAAAAARRGVSMEEEPRIVATQVVSTFLTPFDDLSTAARTAAAAKEDAVVVYTYKMAFRPRVKNAELTPEPYLLFPEEQKAERLGSLIQ